MCALLSGLYIGGNHEGVEGCGAAGLAKEGKKCVFKLSSGNENMGVSRADKSVKKLTKFAH